MTHIINLAREDIGALVNGKRIEVVIDTECPECSYEEARTIMLNPDAPAQPAPSEEDWQTLATAAVNHPEPVKAAEAWRRLHDAALSRLSASGQGLSAGQIIDEATRLAGKNEPDAMDLVPMHRWWWRYSQNLDSMLRHALLDHDQMRAIPAPEKGEAKHNAGPCDASPFSSDGNQAPAQPAPSEEKPNPEFHIEDALKTIKYNDSVANIRLYATVALESALKDLAALRSRLSEPKE